MNDLAKTMNRTARGWTVTFENGTTIHTEPVPHPKIAVAIAIKQYKQEQGRNPGKVKDVKWNS